MDIPELPNDDRSRLARTGLTGDDAPITLKEACRIFAGAITPATLKAEIKRGNLASSKIGRAYFTTARAVAAMLEKCIIRPSLGRGRQKVPDGKSPTYNKAASAAARLTAKNLMASRKASRKRSDAPKRKGITARRRPPPARG